ncbi:hypothetical protein TCAL_10556 [Tigriopus californicus]|uniref:Biogenesis of lysosome-related organelles complex 1 subunit 4 n=1 Tax=Tigriopus californicus TaxID=6832 RepID=A0A553N778_TIGCA|nr:uncharacterized protein LOC131884494 [Tigriopus californicus]TRY61287.1 hypothetical protein TCAL_10556 [Tigriopus californicus]
MMEELDDQWGGYDPPIGESDGSSLPTSQPLSAMASLHQGSAEAKSGSGLVSRRDPSSMAKPPCTDTGTGTGTDTDLDIESELRREKAVLRFTADLADFAQVDWPTQESKIEEDLGDLLIRLDEFQHLLAMSQNDTATCLFQQVPSITQSFPNVERIFHKIDRLEVMVAKIKTNMENMDKLLTQAENTVAGSGIRTFMPMLFGAARPPAAAFMPPMSSNPSEIRVFSTDEFYPKIMKP